MSAPTPALHRPGSRPPSGGSASAAAPHQIRSPDQTHVTVSSLSSCVRRCVAMHYIFSPVRFFNTPTSSHETLPRPWAGRRVHVCSQFQRQRCRETRRRISHRQPSCWVGRACPAALSASATLPRRVASRAIRVHCPLRGCTSGCRHPGAQPSPPRRPRSCSGPPMARIAPEASAATARQRWPCTGEGRRAEASQHDVQGPGEKKEVGGQLR